MCSTSTSTPEFLQFKRTRATHARHCDWMWKMFYIGQSQFPTNESISPVTEGATWKTGSRRLLWHSRAHTAYAVWIESLKYQLRSECELNTTRRPNRSPNLFWLWEFEFQIKQNPVNIQCQIARLHIFNSIEWMEYSNLPVQKLQLFVDRKFGKFEIVKCPTPNVLIQNKNKKKMWIVGRCAGIIFCECVCTVRVWECNVSCPGNVVLMVQANYFCRNNYFHEFFSLSRKQWNSEYRTKWRSIKTEYNSNKWSMWQFSCNIAASCHKWVFPFSETKYQTCHNPTTTITSRKILIKINVFTDKSPYTTAKSTFIIINIISDVVVVNAFWVRARNI